MKLPKNVVPIKKHSKQNNTHTQDFLRFLTSVIERPGMYLVNNVEELSLIIYGYLMGKGDVDCIELMSEFRDFVNKECKTDKKRDHNWPRLVRFYSGSDAHSLTLFRHLFDKFLVAKKITMLKTKE